MRHSRFTRKGRVAMLAAVWVSSHAFGASWDAEALLLAFVEENGARVAGSDAERKAASWIETQWKNMGLTVQRQSFHYKRKEETVRSQNLWIDLKGESEDVMVVGAHYDSTGRGSLGATDNGAGVAVLLALTAQLQQSTLPLSVRLMVFGAEEEGLRGSKAYVATLDEPATSKIRGMINLDTIAGGDVLYVHSAHSTPYQCENGQEQYASATWLRDALLRESNTLFGAQSHKLHPAYPDYPKGETGSWSDHAPFACAGAAVAYIEATNFSIKGRNGFDGYSQSTHDALWNCFDVQSMSACERKKEFKWGNIWHTQYDTLEALQTLFPGRLAFQMAQTLSVLKQFLTADEMEMKAQESRAVSRE